jgi:hypothetical protein
MKTPRQGTWTFAGALLLAFVGACTAKVIGPGSGTDGGTTPTGDGGYTTPDAGNPGSDGGTSPDSGSPSDGGTTPDGGNTPDGGQTKDGGVTVPDAGNPADVLTHHRNLNRDGVYVDPLMTPAAVANAHVDTGFNATTSSNTYAQPLYMQNGADGGNTLFVVTEVNDVFALDANTGAQIWKTNVGTNATKGGYAFCGGSIDPYGISGTPVIDPTTRILYLDAMLAKGVDNKPTHNVFALSIDSGAVLWNIDMDSTVTGFDSTIQNERSALMLLNGTLYVVYGGLDGDCGSYHGWVIGISTANHSNIVTWDTNAPSGAGIWGTSGAASDGTSVFVATTNTNSPFPTVWDAGHSEAILRLTPGLQFVENEANFFTQAQDARNNMQDWYYNDTNDLDLGSSGLVLFDAPGANPSQLAFAVGKTQYAYLLDRNNLGGIATGVAATIPNTDSQVFGSLLAFNTPAGTYVSGPFNVSGSGFCQNGGANMTVLEVTHTSPPNLQFAWCANSGGQAGPIVSTTDGINNAIVWTYGASGDETVRAYDASDAGTLLYTSSQLSGSMHWISPIVANGRFYVAENGKVSAITVR